MSTFCNLFILPPIVVFLIVLCWTIYRYLNPTPVYPVIQKINHCIVGHRAAPIIKQSNEDSKTQPITDDHTKGVPDENGFIIPENTLPSFALSKKSGIVTVELDVQMTKDSQCVVFHDQIIGKTLKCAPGQENLRMCDVTYAEVQAMPFLTTIPGGSNTTTTTTPTISAPSPYSNARVTLLADVLKFCSQENMNIMIEVKPQPNLKSCCDQVVKMVELHKMENNVFVASFTPLVNKYVQSKSNNICNGFLFTPMASTSMKLEFERQKMAIPWVLKSALVCAILDNFFCLLGHPFLLWLSGYKLVMPNYAYLSLCTVEQYRKWGLAVLTWTVNDPKSRDYIFETLNVSVITDHPTLELAQQGSDRAANPKID